MVPEQKLVVLGLVQPVAVVQQALDVRLEAGLVQQALDFLAVAVEEPKRQFLSID